MPKLKSRTYIDRQKFLDIVSENGFECQEQSGYFKIHGPKGRRMYLAKTKMVAHVDLSGFTVDCDEFGVFNLGGNKIGNVLQQLDFERPENEILENFTKILLHMKSLPEVEKVRPSMNISKKKDTSESVVTNDQKKSTEEKLMKMALIEKVSREMGVGISSKTIDELKIDNEPVTNEESELINSIL